MQVTSKTEAKTGRPASISREQILGAALELAKSAPRKAVSISAIARHLGVTPMALYTYYRNKDEMMQALSARMLDNLCIEAPEGATPKEKLTIWSNCVRQYFLDNPHLIGMLIWEGGHSSVAWLNRSKLLFEALEGIGLKGKELGKTAIWVWNCVLSTIMWELHERQTSGQLSDSEIDQLDRALAPRIRRVRDFTSDESYLDESFEFQLERMLFALSGLRRR